jgi:hypothetical protein
LLHAQYRLFRTKSLKLKRGNILNFAQPILE